MKNFNGNPEPDNVYGCKTSTLGIRGWSNEDQNIRLSLASWFCCLFWFCLNRLKVHFESLVKLYGSFRAKWLLKKYVRVQSSWKSTLHKVHFLYHGPFYTCCDLCRFFLQFVNYAVSDLWSRLSHISLGKSDFELNRTLGKTIFCHTVSCPAMTSFFVCWPEYFLANKNQQ